MKSAHSKAMGFSITNAWKETISFFQRPALPPPESKPKHSSLNADIIGQTGYSWDIPGLHATNLRSKNRFLNDLCRGINNTVGLGAGVVNYANNVAGTVLLDLPAKVEDLIVSKGGPSFQELFITSQTATPGMPIDDMLMYGLKKLTNFSKKLEISRQKLISHKPIGFRPGELERHFTKHFNEWGAENLSKEIYLAKAKNLLSQKPNKEILEHIRRTRDILRYSVETNEFAIGAPDGTIRTFFRPKDGIEYWLEVIKSE